MNFLTNFELNETLDCVNDISRGVGGVITNYPHDVDVDTVRLEKLYNIIMR